MPRGDGTGPMGAGPMTGRRAGLCVGYPMPGFANPEVPRMGMGWGRRRGFGRGRGLGMGYGRGPGRGYGRFYGWGQCYDPYFDQPYDPYYDPYYMPPRRGSWYRW
ncbi:MAG: DUF5320 domain-containing protein [Methanomassiliicoccales archaeon]|nr:DUF5320 domain-containing protein [Methanomassiliicoccales archaeon]NYT15867.1 DUF5320 domain-containing protein [Methanomassiliicoccales archaeon]